jgi:hypothetical protein
MTTPQGLREKVNAAEELDAKSAKIRFTEDEIFFQPELPVAAGCDL